MVSTTSLKPCPNPFSQLISSTAVTVIESNTIAPHSLPAISTPISSSIAHLSTPDQNLSSQFSSMAVNSSTAPTLYTSDMLEQSVVSVSDATPAVTKRCNFLNDPINKVDMVPQLHKDESLADATMRVFAKDTMFPNYYDLRKHINYFAQFWGFTPARKSKQEVECNRVGSTQVRKGFVYQNIRKPCSVLKCGCG